MARLFHRRVKAPPVGRLEASADRPRAATPFSSLLSRIAAPCSTATGAGIARALLAGLICLIAAAPALAALEDGVGAWHRKDFASAIKELRPLAERGNAEAQAYMAAAYLAGDGTPRDVEQGVKLARLSAAQGNAVGENYLGVAYLAGLGVEKDVAEAARWFRKSAEQGFAEGESNLGLMYWSGVGVARDPVEAARWFRRAAEQDNGIAAFQLGRAYYEGRGVGQDYKQALVWFRRGAAHGSADAENMLGVVYFTGRGTRVDYAEALRWYRRAVAENHPAALYNLATAYYEGKGTGQDYRRAGVLYDRAARLGFARAQSMLGGMYLRGIGVPQDYRQGYFWLSLAAARLPAGTERANVIRARDDLAARLTPEEIARTQAATRLWQPATPRTGVQAAGQPDPAPAPPPDDKRKPAATGSGFLVNQNGYVLTNRHVIASCREIRVRGASGTSREARLVAIDERGDLALLRADLPGATALRFREGAGIRPGDEVVALGYPLAGVLASQVNVTIGAVSALAGVRNDARYLQMSAPIQPGNSGGPLLDLSGHVVGIVSAKLNALALAGRTGDIAQNVNFALKASVMRDFLDAHRIAYQAAPSTRDFKAADVGERGRTATVFIECLGR
jgi:TPR repeat protein